MSDCSLTVLNAIDDAIVIRERHPALFARMSRADCSCVDLGQAYECFLAGIPTRWWFTGERVHGRTARRAAGKRQRQARRIQQRRARP